MSKKTKVRILVAQPIGAISYKPNDVVNIDQAKIKALEKDGVADSSPAAVAYAMTLGDPVLDHPDDVAESPKPDDGGTGSSGGAGGAAGAAGGGAGGTGSAGTQ